MFLFQKDLVALLRKKVNLLLCKKKRKLFFFSLSHFSLGQPNSPSLPLFIFSRSAQSVPRPSSLSGPTASLHSLSPTGGAHLSWLAPTSGASPPPRRARHRPPVFRRAPWSASFRSPNRPPDCSIVSPVVLSPSTALPHAEPRPGRPDSATPGSSVTRRRDSLIAGAQRRHQPRLSHDRTEPSRHRLIRTVGSRSNGPEPI